MGLGEQLSWEVVLWVLVRNEDGVCTRRYQQGGRICWPKIMVNLCWTVGLKWS